MRRPILILLIMGSFNLFAIANVDSSLAEYYFNTADSLSQVQKYELAIQQYENSAIEYKKLEQWSKWLICFSKIGWRYTSLSRYAEAESCLKKALKEAQLHLNTRDLAFAKIYNTLGELNQKQEFFDSAETYYFNALNIYENLELKMWQDISAVYNNIGVMYRRCGNYDKAIKYFVQDLEITIREESINSPALVPGYNNMGIVYWNKGDYDTAYKYLRRALQLMINQELVEQWKIGLVYNNIGILLYETKDYERSANNYQQALKILTESLGENHPYIPTIYNNMGEVEKMRNQKNTALAYFEKALVMESTDEITKAALYSNIGEIYLSTKDYGRAVLNQQRALEGFVHVFGENHPNICAVYKSFHNINRSQKNFDNALKSLQNGFNALNGGYALINIYVNPHLKILSSSKVLLELLELKSDTFYLKWENTAINSKFR